MQSLKLTTIFNRGYWLWGNSLATAALALAASLLIAFWAWDRTSEAHATAQRAEENLERAHQAMTSLARVTPRQMPSQGFRDMVAQLEKRLSEIEADNRAIRSVNAQSLGILSGVPSARHQGRIELAGLTLAQVAVALDAVESSGLPCWIDAMDLSATGETSDLWNATLQVQWLSPTTAAGERP